MAGFYALRYRESIKDPATLSELDDLVAHFNHQLAQIMTAKGTILPAALVVPQGTKVTDEEHWWRNGPWTLDDPSAGDPHVAGLRPPDIPGGSYNDYAPAGIENAIVVEVEPITSNVTLTGLKAPSPMRKRMILFRNRDSSLSVILKHADTGSQPQNRFNLPSSTDIELGPYQNVWLYYDLARGSWTAAITTQKAGGFNVGGASSGGDVVGPASATDGHLAIFDGTTGKLIKDGGALGTITGGTIAVASVNLTDAQIKSLNTSPVAMVGAPGVGQYILPLFLVGSSDTTATAYSASPGISLRFANGTADVTDQLSYNLGTTTTLVRFHTPVQSSPATGSKPTNQALNAFSSADVTGGNAANFLKLRLVYAVVTI